MCISSIFVKINNKTFLFQSKENKYITILELLIHAWNKYLLDSNRDILENPSNLLGKTNFLKCHNVSVNNKIYNYENQFTEINLSDYNNSTFYINPIISNINTKFTEIDINLFLKVDFRRFDN